MLRVWYKRIYNLNEFKIETNVIFHGSQVGDQIIEVNGQSFEEATHDEAVEILKTNKRMTLLIRDVGKVPHSCTTSQPIVMPTSRYPEHDPLLLESPGNHRPPSPT